MIHTTASYIVYTAGHRRHHGGSQTQLIPSATGTATAGDNIPVTAFASLPYNGNNLPFAFMSVTGAADGSHLFVDSGTQHIQVGNTDINVLVVYAPEGSPGVPHVPEVWVDAFNVDIGAFSDSDFMQVYTNGVLDIPMTDLANNEGDVSSASPEDMRAYSTVDGVPFLEWKKIGGAVDNKPDYDLQMDEGGLIFAFYQTPPSQSSKRPNLNEQGKEGFVWVSGGVMVDGPGFKIGPNGVVTPVKPWGPYAAKFYTAMALISLSENMPESLKEGTKELVVNLIKSIAGSIETNKEGF